jgi:signal transduction histidine kinase
MAAARDITERRKARDELLAATAAAEQANRTKSRFLATMSHEFRTPLNSVIGFANVLLKRASSRLEEEEREYLRRIRSNGESLLLLVNDILDLSKVEAGRVEIHKTDVALDRLLDEVVEQLDVQARAKELRLVRAPGGPWPPIRTDEQRLRQILINLVGNAIKFTEKGSVTLRVHAEGSRPTRIDVEDTGIGISAEDRQKIFDAFHQVDASASRTYQGTGLGLAISRSLSELLGYRVTFESTPGRGTVFHVWLDADAAAGSA